MSAAQCHEIVSKIPLNPVNNLVLYQVNSFVMFSLFLMLAECPIIVLVKFTFCVICILDLFFYSLNILLGHPVL